jgi:hypothetical protein
MPDISMGAFPRRSDLVDEIYDTFNDNGNYVSGWYDSSGIDSIRVATYGLTAAEGYTSVDFQIQEAQFSSNSSDGSTQPVRIQTLTITDGTGWAELKLTGRFFLLSVTNGVSGDPVTITIRAV